MDIALWYDQMSNENETVDGCVRKLLGGTPQEKPDLCREATPLAHISPGMPPFLIFHGDKDVAVPLSQSEALETRLKEVGGEVTRIVVRNGLHSLAPADDTGSSPTLEEILQMKVQFLRQRLPAMS